MTPSNLDLAREVGATYDHQWVDEYVVAGLRFTPLQLDAFAERIRADEREEIAVMADGCSDGWLDAEILVDFAEAIRARSSTAPVQPVAVPAVTVEHDSTPLLPSGMPEPVASVYTMEALVQGGSPKCHVSLLQPLAAGTKLYTAAQVQAILSQGLAPGWQAVPVATLTDWKRKVNNVAALTLKAERYSYGASLKQDIADIIAAAPQPPDAQQQGCGECGIEQPAARVEPAHCQRPDLSTLDRWPDKGGNYSPENCRWATPSQQANNTKSNRFVSVEGAQITIREACNKYLLDYQAVRSALYRKGQYISDGGVVLVFV